MTDNTRAKAFGGKKLNFSVGLVVFVFAVIGIVSMVFGSIKLINESREEKKEAQYASYNRFLIPAAAIDIQPFDDISSASMSELVEMCVWSVLNGGHDPAEFDYEGGELVIPASYVESEFVKYFGDTIAIAHCTVEGYGYEFSYDANANTYSIPVTTISPIYTPKVEKTESKGGATVLTCGLVNATVWTQNSVTGELESPIPDKYIKITLRTSGNSEYISAIQLSSAPEVATTKTGSGQTTQQAQPDQTTAEQTEEDSTAQNEKEK